MALDADPGLSVTAADREKWDRRYREGAYSERTHPTRLLEAHVRDLPVGRALDIACGAGRNAIYLASLGFDVDAIDISPVALDRARSSAEAAAERIRFIAADLTAGLPAALDPAATYDLIVMVRYVNTPLIGQLCERVAPGGFLLCEEHLQTAVVDVAGPRSAAHKVAHGELASALATLETRFYREGIVTDPDGRRVALAQAIATRGATSELNYC